MDKNIILFIKKLWANMVLTKEWLTDFLLSLERWEHKDLKNDSLTWNWPIGWMQIWAISATHCSQSVRWSLTLEDISVTNLKKYI